MRFQATITTPANTSKTNPLTTILPITLGLIHKVGVYIPPGHSGLTGAALCDGLFQFHPMTNTEYLRGDNLNESDDIMYLKENEPSQIFVLTYNLDDTYPHSHIISVHVEDKDVFIARYMPTVQYDYMKKVIEGMGVEQAALKAEILAHPFKWLPRGKS